MFLVRGRKNVFISREEREREVYEMYEVGLERPRKTKENE